MKITSHFLGASLDPKVFVDLYVELQTYLHVNDLESAVTLSNPLSTHVTVYYLCETLEKSEKSEILSDLRLLNDKYSQLQIHVSTWGYFKHNGKESLCYLSPRDTEKLSEINGHLRNRFQNNVADNSFDYVPHITIFYIKNHELFSKHQDAIQSIFDKNLLAIGKQNVFKSFQLYSVNSEYEPEIQLVEQ